MRLSTTTRELVACLSRPALRALREVGTSLGQPVPEQGPGRAEEPLAGAPAVPVPEWGASAGEVPPAAPPEAPPRTAYAAPPEESSLPAPTLERLQEARLPQEETARHEVAPPPGRRLLRVLPRTPRKETPSSRPEAPRAEGTHSLPDVGERAPRPLLAPRPGGRSALDSPRMDSPRMEDSHGGSGVEPLAQTRPERPMSPAPLAVPIASSSLERVEAPRPRTRLVFLPVPAGAGPASSSSVPRSGPISALARQVANGLTPVWDEASRLSHEALTVERAAQPARVEVKNTFNVQVNLEPGGGSGGVERDDLEESLVDILRDAARRHGLEV